MIKKMNNEAIKALAAAFSKFDPDDPRQRRAMATKVVQMVVEDVYTQDVVSLIADTQDFAPGEVVQFHFLKPLMAYILEPGTTGKRSKLIKDSVELTTERVNVSTELDLDQLRSGRYGTLNDYRRLVGEALLGKRNKQVWDVLNFSITSSDNDGNYATFASGAATSTKKSALDAAIDYVHDNTNSGPAAIIGRYTALNWIYAIADQSNVNTFSDMTKEEIQRRGFMAVYRGVPIFYLRSYKDADGNVPIDNTNIHVVSDGTVKMGRKTPGLESFDKINGATYTWEIDFWEQYGSLVVQRERNYRLQIS